MHYDEIEQLRERHPAWSLLRASNAALVLSFVGRVFVHRNVGDLAASTASVGLRASSAIS